MGEVTQILRHEHDTILFVLKILNKMVQTKAAEDDTKYSHCIALVDFLQLFTEKSHHGKEHYLIEALKDTGLSQYENEIDIIQREHEQGQSTIVKMINALGEKDYNEFYNSSVQYSSYLENCIERENLSLFDFSDHALDDEKQDELLEEFLDIEKSVIGRDLYRNMHDMISTWTDIIGI